MRSALRTGPAPRRGRQATPISPVGSGWLLAGLAVMALVLPRWAVDRWQAPLETIALPGGAVILVVQPGDCPDRTHTLSRWLLTLPPPASDGPRASDATSPGGLPHSAALPDIRIGVVGRQDLPLSDPVTAALKDIPRLEAAHAQAAGRALSRLGVEGTPALLVVDPRGRPVLVSDFTPEGRIPGLELALRLGLPGLDPSLGQGPIPTPLEPDVPPPSNPE